MADVSELKNSLRAYYRHIRDGIGSEERAASAKAIIKLLTGCEQYRTAELVLCYVSSEKETDTLELIVRALADGKKVACPRCDKNTHTMTFHEISSLNQLKPGAYGIFEPLEELPGAQSGEVQNSICIVPGLAFDRLGGRLGYGGGYYDRFLAGYSGCAIGLCPSDCLSAAILPADKYDLPVDMVITDMEIISSCRSSPEQR